jgi:hypothetical protein
VSNGRASATYLNTFEPTLSLPHSGYPYPAPIPNPEVLLSTELEKRVESWLNSTGYPLEMRVVRTVKDSGGRWTVEANQTYRDRSTGAHREVDLALGRSCSTQGFNFWIELVIECKSTSEPWVVLRHHSSSPTFPQLNLYGFNLPMAIVDSDDSNMLSFLERVARDIDGAVPARPESGHAIVEAFRKAGAKDSAYSATRQVMSAVRHRIEFEIGEPSAPHSPSLSVFCPIVITTSPLFEATLSEAAEGLILEPVSRTSVSCPGDDAEIDVVVVAESALSALLEEYTSTVDLIAEHIQNFGGLARGSSMRRRSIF